MCGSMYLYRVRSFDELDRLPASKKNLHFINMKCFSHTGNVISLNKSGNNNGRKKNPNVKLMISKHGFPTGLHRNLRWHRKLRWPLV
ncbi:hypothetical protein HanXRQr2_Chr17g0799511 [Helianthus annuus]|uniref:Uncharacterized protein n=1 Tax=Helianthus annuus TaxID=4232 RepID=A0A9K3DH34_HELAN|nr:hypothetical protein HanXRQr2_Chr17g0799511 [Helianthus annuus]